MLNIRLKTDEDASPAPGVVNCHNLAEYINDEVNQGIDISYEEYLEDNIERIKQEMRDEGIEEDSDEWDEKLTDLTQDVEMEYEHESPTILVGDWKRNIEGKYEIDPNGNNGWAGTFNSSNGDILVVEYSKYVADCNQTSPCYRRADTGGPCGDLDTPNDGADKVVSYCLPPEYFS